MIHEKSDQFEAEVIRMKPRAQKILRAMQIRPTVLAAVRRYLVPATRLDAVEGLYYTLPPALLSELRAMKHEDLIDLHHTLGRDIRNLFKMWEEASPLVKDCGGHPDDAAMLIIEGLWKRLQIVDERLHGGR